MDGLLADISVPSVLLCGGVIYDGDSSLSTRQQTDEHRRHDSHSQQNIFWSIHFGVFSFLIALFFTQSSRSRLMPHTFFLLGRVLARFFYTASLNNQVLTIPSIIFQCNVMGKWKKKMRFLEISHRCVRVAFERFYRLAECLLTAIVSVAPFERDENQQPIRRNGFKKSKISPFRRRVNFHVHRNIWKA